MPYQDNNLNKANQIAAEEFFKNIKPSNMTQGTDINDATPGIIYGGPTNDVELPITVSPVQGTARGLTYGEKLVGLNFNPANDDKVGKAKRLCADLADLLYDDYFQTELTDLKRTLYEHTIGEILNAQMNVVKVLTLKY